MHFDDLPDASPRVPRTEPLRERQLAFGYSQEDLRVLLAPTFWLVLLPAYWIARNLPWFPFTLLAPP